MYLSVLHFETRTISKEGLCMHNNILMLSHLIHSYNLQKINCHGPERYEGHSQCIYTS